jgi:hypothetical protein
MKRYTVLVVALGFALCVLVPGALQVARAQGAQGEPAAAADKELQKLRTVLGLSAAQESRLDPILQAEIPKIEAIKNNPSLSGEEKVKQAQAVQAQADPQMKAILSSTQYQQWQNLRLDELNQLKNSVSH